MKVWLERSNINDDEGAEIFKVKKNGETIKGEALHYEDLYNYAFVLGQVLLLEPILIIYHDGSI